jgi:hypothetical protein
MPVNELISHNLTLLAKDYRQVHKHTRHPEPTIDLVVNEKEIAGNRVYQFFDTLYTN